MTQKQKDHTKELRERWEVKQTRGNNRHEYTLGLNSVKIADIEFVTALDAEDYVNLIAALPDLLFACGAGATSTHHPTCSHGKRGDGNTCECHVKKCQQAIAKAEGEL